MWYVNIAVTEAKGKASVRSLVRHYFYLWHRSRCSLEYVWLCSLTRSQVWLQFNYWSRNCNVKGDTVVYLKVHLTSGLAVPLLKRNIKYSSMRRECLSSCRKFHCKTYMTPHSWRRMLQNGKNGKCLSKY